MKTSAVLTVLLVATAFAAVQGRDLCTFPSPFLADFLSSTGVRFLLLPLLTCLSLHLVLYIAVPRFLLLHLDPSQKILWMLLHVSAW
jgi:hypothetical protein